MIHAADLHPAPFADLDTYALLSVADLAKLPPPSYLVDPFIRVDAFNVLFGPSGGGKSFLALDFALCIATGLHWHGRAVKSGPVLYIAAEGVAGLHRRIAAWKLARHVDEIEGIAFLPEAPNLLDAEQLDKAARTIENMPEPPALIVVDTMARTMIGGDENAARDVGQFIAAVDGLRRAHETAALVIHHTGKNGEDERGSSALRGAADMMLSLKPEGAGLRLECSKAKDAEPFQPWNLHLSGTLESCVIRLGSNQGEISPQERDILQSLTDAFGRDQVPSTRLLKACGVPERSYYRAVKALTDRGFVESAKVGRSTNYSLTDEGEHALLPTPANACQTPGPTTAASHPPLGVAGVSQDSNTNQSIPVVPGAEFEHDADAEHARLAAKFGEPTR